MGIVYYLLLSYFGCHILLIGFPRTLQQAKTLHIEENVNVVISLDVPAEEIIQRYVNNLNISCTCLHHNNNYIIYMQ